MSGRDRRQADDATDAWCVDLIPKIRSEFVGSPHRVQIPTSTPGTAAPAADKLHSRQHRGQSITSRVTHPLYILYLRWRSHRLRHRAKCVCVWRGLRCPDVAAAPDCRHGRLNPCARRPHVGPRDLTLTISPPHPYIPCVGAARRAHIMIG